MDSFLTTYAVVAISFLLLGLLLSTPSNLAKWVQKKKYQYEVTFSLYMLTPREKFVFNSIVFLFISMVLIACTLYLPEHIAIVTRRAFYYYAGDTKFLVSSQKAAENIVEQAAKATDAVIEAANGWLGVTQRGAVNAMNTGVPVVEEVLSAATTAAAAAGAGGNA